jgi:hypothetical protein
MDILYEHANVGQMGLLRKLAMRTIAPWNGSTVRKLPTYREDGHKEENVQNYYCFIFESPTREIRIRFLTCGSDLVDEYAGSQTNSVQ